MLRKWIVDVVSAREIASELKAYLVGMAGRIDEGGWLHVSAQDALEDARKVGHHRRSEPGIVDGLFRCTCGGAHPLRDAMIDCECGSHYQVHWSSDGWCVVDSKQ